MTLVGATLFLEYLGQQPVRSNRVEKRSMNQKVNGTGRGIGLIYAIVTEIANGSAKLTHSNATGIENHHHHHHHHPVRSNLFSPYPSPSSHNPDLPRVPIHQQNYSSCN